MKEKIELYKQLVDKCRRFEIKGKNNLYTSANGHMFSMFNKEWEFGIRYSKAVQEKYIKEFGTGYLKSYGATMRGYVVIPEEFWNDLDKMAELLNESYDYIITLDPK